ncbi:PAS domain S-box protein [Candidatus Bathyarchaeota archaeon]|nr:PAS domain S-box protein [Candidatus Bathyarchaeota archaeon]
MQENTNHQSATLDMLGLGYMIVKNGAVTYANASLLDLAGVSFKDFQSQGFKWIKNFTTRHSTSLDIGDLIEHGSINGLGLWILDGGGIPRNIQFQVIPSSTVQEDGQTCLIIRNNTKEALLKHHAKIKDSLAIKLEGATRMDFICKYCLEAALELACWEVGSIFMRIEGGDFVLVDEISMDEGYNENIRNILQDTSFLNDLSTGSVFSLQCNDGSHELTPIQCVVEGLALIAGSSLVFPIIVKGELNAVLIMQKGNGFTLSSGSMENLLSITIQGAGALARARLESKLYEHHEKYRLIYENSTDLIFSCDESININFCNEWALQKILGYNLGEIMEIGLDRLVHPNDIKLIRATVKHVLNHIGTVQQREVRLKGKNGLFRWFEFKASSYLNELGQRILLLVGRDIHEKKENQLVLQESEDRYRIITSIAHDLIAIISAGGHIEFLNEEAHASMLGIEASMMDGKPFKQLLDPADADSFDYFRESCLVKGGGEIMVRMKRAFNEDVAWFELVANTLTGKSGTPKIIMIARDITERKKLEYMLERENERLRKVEKLRRDFISTTTHELKTPLSSICGASDFLHDHIDELPKKEVRKFITLMVRGSRRLRHLVDKLLDFSRIDSQRLVINKKQTNIIPIIKDIAESFEYQVESRKLSLELEIPMVLEAPADASRFGQVLTNLISNAIKNTPPGGVIKIKTKVNGGMLFIAVEDTGIGITKEEKRELFGKFVKLDRSHVKKNIDIRGTGIGLFISREIIHAHGGRIWVESSGRDKGSTFIFNVPLHEDNG